jgi:hypothetical protein
LVAAIIASVATAEQEYCYFNFQSITFVHVLFCNDLLILLQYEFGLEKNEQDGLFKILVRAVVVNKSSAVLIRCRRPLPPKSDV